MRWYLFCVFILLIPSTAIAGTWQVLVPGMELGKFTTNYPVKTSDTVITILRIDPTLWDLNFVGISNSEETNSRTAKQWSNANQLAATINAGMFFKDNRTHVGFLKYQEHSNNSKVNKYQSVAAFNPKRNSLQRFHIFDLDSTDVSMKMILQNYHSVVQNLRLIKRPGHNRWSQQKKMWSEAALGEDTQGRILFIFSRSPLTMHDFNEALLTMGIGLVSAQHLEGGPEAQLYIHVGKVELELFGSYETSFNENDKNNKPWPIPNVLGVRPRY